MEPLDADVPRQVDQIDLLIEQATRISATVEDLIRHQQTGNNQTIIHKSDGISAWGAAAVTACMLTFLGLILFAIVVIPELHDLKAWSDIYRSKIYALEKKP